MLGISQIKEYIDEAKKRGYSAIGITDVDTTEGFIEAYKYAKSIKNEIDWTKYYYGCPDEEEMKLIYGVKTRICEDSNILDPNKTYDIMIIVKEQNGLKNLYKLLTKAYKNKSAKLITIVLNITMGN